MQILLVEDDYLEEGLLRKILTGKPFRIPDEEIETISTEQDFRDRISDIAQSQQPPQLVIMDVMIRWTDPTPGELNMDQIPAAVKQEGPYRAGLRCAEMLDKLNPQIPILFYTILEREDLDTDLLLRRSPDRTIDHVKKRADVDYARKDKDDSVDEDSLVGKLCRFLVASEV
jgi:CheY-like chemotaxis protein